MNSGQLHEPEEDFPINGSASGEQAIPSNEFEPLCQDVDEDKLRKLWDKGRIAWQNIGSATAWVEELRGSREWK